MEVLPAGLWCDLVLTCLPVAEVLHFRLCSRGCAQLVSQQIPRLVSSLAQQQASLLQDPEILRLQEGLKPLCELLLSTKTYPKIFAEMTQYKMMPPLFSDLRFIFMNIMQQTHNPSHLARFNEELDKRDFSCLHSKQALGRTLQRIGGYLASYSRAEVVAARLDGRVYDFIEGFADLTLNVPDRYYSKKAAIQTLAGDLRILQRLANKVSSRK